MKLFDLIAIATHLSVNDVEVETIGFGKWDGPYDCYSMNTADEDTYYFSNQEVVLIDGEVKATAHDYPSDKPQTPEEVKISFSVLRPLNVTDLV